MIVCLCGSLRFESAFQDESRRLALLGSIVLQPVFGLQDLSPQQIEDLHTLHRKKIEMSAEVRIINPGGYIGTSTQQEIQYAQSLGKKVSYYFEEAV